MYIKEMIGKKFGELTVLERVEDRIYKNGRHDIQYKCKCSCGNEVIVLGTHLRSGHTKSCGCERIKNTQKMRITHGKTNTRLYAIWKNMKSRCMNPNNKKYNSYGGRGIKICKEWTNDFSKFYEWAIKNGYDSNLSIDRIDVNGNYCPENCRWLTQKEQCNNTRRNVILEYNNESHTIKEWAEIKGIKYGTLYSRINRGWTVKKALEY